MKGICPVRVLEKEQQPDRPLQNALELPWNRKPDHDSVNPLGSATTEHAGHINISV